MAPTVNREVNMEVMNMEVVAPQILVQILGAITGKVKGTILVNVMGTAVVEADLVKRCRARSADKRINLEREKWQQSYLVDYR